VVWVSAEKGTAIVLCMVQNSSLRKDTVVERRFVEGADCPSVRSGAGTSVGTDIGTAASGTFAASRSSDASRTRCCSAGARTSSAPGSAAAGRVA